MAITRKEAEGVVVQESFQAVDELSSQVQKAISGCTQTVAWNLAFSSNFCATIDHNILVTSQDTIVSPARNHSDKPDCGQPAETTGQSSKPDHFATSTTTNSEKETVKETEKYIPSLKVARTTWPIAKRTAEELIQHIGVQHQVELEINSRNADSRVIVTTEGRNAQDVELAHPTLVKITMDVEKELISENMPLQAGTDISCIQKIPWIELRTI